MLESPMTVVVNCCFPPDVTEAVVGVMFTATEGTVIVEAADFVESLAEVAVSVTLRSFAGGVGGAAYVAGIPLRVEVGETAPHEAAAQVRVQFTPALLGSPCTSAKNCIVAPTCTVSTASATDTLMT